MTLDWIRMLFDYNYWAERRLLDVMGSMSLEKLTGQMGYSWGSPKALLVHMLSAEWLWRQRWLGTSPSALLDPEEFPDMAAIRARWTQDEMEMRAFLTGLVENDLQREVRYITTKGEPGKELLGQLLFHVLNHSNHHRGELAAMLALLDVPHPEDDLLFYFREGAYPDSAKVVRNPV